MPLSFLLSNICINCGADPGPRPFWQAESYDHWVRTEGEWQRIIAYIAYIEENPVKAGLVQRAADYRWSSASAGSESAETSLGAADTSGSPPSGRSLASLTSMTKNGRAKSWSIASKSGAC